MRLEFDTADWPTVLHVTHAKAGSQWIHKILHHCAPDRIVAPQYDVVQFLHSPIRSGAIYPTLYLARKTSHVVDHPVTSEYRAALRARSLEDGLVWSTGTAAFELCADVQRSWQDLGERLIRYEDLLERDEEVLTRVLLDECGMPIECARLRRPSTLVASSA